MRTMESVHRRALRLLEEYVLVSRLTARLHLGNPYKEDRFYRRRPRFDHVLPTC